MTDNVTPDSDGVVGITEAAETQAIPHRDAVQPQPSGLGQEFISSRTFIPSLLEKPNLCH